MRNVTDFADASHRRGCVKRQTMRPALGFAACLSKKGQKPLITNAFALSGRCLLMHLIPRAMPWAVSYLPLWGALLIVLKRPRK